MALEAGLYLIPTQLSDVPLERVVPAYNVDVVRELRYFVVESLRSARRFLKKCDRSIDIDSLTMNELNEHTDLKDTAALVPSCSGLSPNIRIRMPHTSASL